MNSLEFCSDKAPGKTPDYYKRCPRQNPKQAHNLKVLNNVWVLSPGKTPDLIKEAPGKTPSQYIILNLNNVRDEAPEKKPVYNKRGPR